MFESNAKDLVIYQQTRTPLRDVHVAWKAPPWELAYHLQYHWIQPILQSETSEQQSTLFACVKDDCFSLVLNCLYLAILRIMLKAALKTTEFSAPVDPDLRFPRISSGLLVPPVPTNHLFMVRNRP